MVNTTNIEPKKVEEVKDVITDIVSEFYFNEVEGREVEVIKYLNKEGKVIKTETK